MMYVMASSASPLKTKFTFQVFTYPTPECEVNGTECYDGWAYDLFIYLFTYDMRYWWRIKLGELADAQENHQNKFHCYN